VIKFKRLQFLSRKNWYSKLGNKTIIDLKFFAFTKTPNSIQFGVVSLYHTWYSIFIAW